MVPVTEIYTRDSLQNWRNVNVNIKSLSPRPHQIKLEQIFKENRFKGPQIIILHEAPTCLDAALAVS
jgi:hypothetical protein